MNPLHLEQMMIPSFSSSTIVYTYDGIPAPRIPIDATTASSEESLINWKSKATSLCFIRVVTFQERSSSDFGGR